MQPQPESNAADLRRELREYHSSFEAMNAVVRALNRPTADVSALESAFVELMRSYRCRHMLMLYMPRSEGEPEVFLQRQVGSEAIARLSSASGREVLGKVFRQILSIVDVIERELFLKLDSQTAEWARFMEIAGEGSDFMLLTLKSNRRPVGMLVMGYKDSRSWSAREKESLSFLGVQLGMALENLLLFDRVQAARREWEATVDSMRDMVFFVNPEGLIQRANMSLSRYSGLPVDELIGKPCASILGCGLQFETCPYNRDAMSSGMESFEMRGPADNTYRVLLTPFRIAGDKTSGTVHLVSDITEEKAKLVLEEEKRQLIELDRLKNSFMASITHELKTPLNAVIGFSELLLSGTYGELSEKQSRYLENIYTSGKHLLSLISDILDYMRMESQNVSLHMEVLDVRELLLSTLELMRQEADRKGICMELVTEEGDLELRADRRRIRQVLFNLLSNALKFTPRGGRVVLSARAAGDEMIIAVQDNGLGIDHRDQERLFREFTQGGEGVKRGEGAGLGLALSKSLVELHGGRIWLRSEPGEGSTFYFSLPLGSTGMTTDKGG